MKFFLYLSVEKFLKFKLLTYLDEEISYFYFYLQFLIEKALAIRAMRIKV